MPIPARAFDTADARRRDGDVHRVQARALHGRRTRSCRCRVAAYARRRRSIRAIGRVRCSSGPDSRARCPMRSGAIAATCTREPSAPWRSSAARRAWPARRCSPAALRSRPGRARSRSGLRQPRALPSIGAQPELMLRSADAALTSGADVLVVGPGLGLERDAHRARRRGRAHERPARPRRRCAEPHCERRHAPRAGARARCADADHPASGGSRAAPRRRQTRGSLPIALPRHARSRRIFAHPAC